jgi:hypothetical protein
MIQKDSNTNTGCQDINYYFDDFTEENYRNILRLAKSNYQSISFSDYNISGKCILLRHDVDYSVHRALKLAEIESEEDIRSTFFLWMHSPFYNLFEEEISEIVRKIIGLGHEIGLHFDTGFYECHTLKNVDIMNHLSYEKSIIEHFIGKPVTSFSLHNPSDSMIKKFRLNSYRGMVNTYSKYIRMNFEYCSDSSGYWRFRRLQDMLEKAEFEKIQILTHPEWWTPDILHPRERISRCIEGRRKKQHEWYDSMLKGLGRENVH